MAAANARGQGGRGLGGASPLPTFDGVEMLRG
jgi:hypothetical protein